MTSKGFPNFDLNQLPFSINLQDSGFMRIEKGPMVAFLDVGEIGPTYNSAHAHADTLSFELTLFNDRFLVNSGTSCYERSAERSWQRGTSAHNTVTVDGQDSSEVWDSFRVARRAIPIDSAVKESVGEVYVRCSHDGYLRFGNGSLHTREWIFRKSEVQVKDRIDGSFNEAIAYYHFHPGVMTGLDQDGRQGWARTLNGEVVNWRITGGIARILESTFHPQFGQTVRNQCLTIVFEKPMCEITFNWK